MQRNARVGWCTTRVALYKVVAALDPALCRELLMPHNVLCAKRIPQAELLALPSTKVIKIM